MILNLFSPSTFINVYFLGVIVGRILFLFSYSFFPVSKGDISSMGGSSAGVMAAIIFMCTYSPDNEIRLFFFNLKLKYIGILFFVFDIIQIPYGNSGGHIANVGGAILGFFYARNLINDFENCIESLEGNTEYKLLNTFKHLVVYERATN